MQFRNVTGSPLEATADLLAISVSGAPDKDVAFKAANRASGGVLAKLIKEEQFAGKVGQTIVACLDGFKAKRVVLLGAGPREKQSSHGVRDLAARAAKLGRSKGARTVLFVTPGSNTDDDRATALGFSVEGAILGSYKFDQYKKKNKAAHAVKTFAVCTDSTGKQKPGGKKTAGTDPKSVIKRAAAVAAATCNARDYINEPAAVMTPTKLAAISRGLARTHARVTCKVYGRKECEKLGMGMFLAVSQGSTQEPKLIHLTYKPAKPTKSAGKKKSAPKKIAFIGKGVTFDSGGYSLKPSSGMEDMKIDMSGSAAVIAAMGAIAEVGSSHEVHVVAACCENMVSGGAYKLGDVLTGMDGTTVEINNTDAEGRLTLGDAITFTRTRIKPDEMFDFATLTGACMVALGPHTAGVLSNNENLVAEWLGNADAAGEDMWRMPLNARLKDQLKSNIAQMRNTGERWGGAITAGLFLAHFAGDTPWVHVDIAGPASSNHERGATLRGGVGFAVASICQHALK